MATNKPSSNSPPGDDSPKDNNDDDGAPQDGSTSNRLEDAKKEIKRLLARLESERKRSQRLRELLEGEKGNVKRMKTSIEENNSHYNAKLEKIKGKVDGQVATAKATKAAAEATVRSKVAIAKEKLEAKDFRLKDALKLHRTVKKELQNKKTDLDKSTDKVVNLERKVSGLNRDLINLIAEKDGLKKQAAAFKSASEKAKAAISSQLIAKLAHQQEMAKLYIKKAEVTLAREEAKKKTKNEQRTKDQLEKRKYFEYMTTTRANEKDKDVKRKEEAKRKKSEESIKKLEYATAQMNRTTRTNGGSFPNPARTSLGEVSRFLVSFDLYYYMPQTALPLACSSFHS